MLPPELVLPVAVTAIVAATCWVLGLLFDEYSWVDRLWSVVPPVYIGLFAAQADFTDPRLNLMTALTALWGARLTFNYARKGGYARGGEDYRWRVLKARMSSLQWHAFHLLFIASYQHTLLLLIALPAWTALQHRGPLGAADVALAVLFLVLLAGEFLADQQQWDFHQQKKARAAAGAAEPKGFLDTGLWAWSRHPNFFFEQAQWWVVYGYAIVASGSLLHGTVLGPVLLTLLFHGSARFTESITASKYPAYADYQGRVSRMLPLPPRSA
jgi:steroid 5-alpha reductase family enzyme